jgi:hypothetical protein
MYVRMYVCVCRNVCMYVCMYVCVGMYVCTYYYLIIFTVVMTSVRVDTSISLWDLCHRREKRENGAIVRRRDAEEKIRLEKLEEERKRRIWEETPRRKKGWMSAICIRRFGHFAVLTTYR